MQEEVENLNGLGLNMSNYENKLEVVNIDDLLESLQEMTVDELVTLVNMCTQVIDDKTTKF